ncbi:MAG: SCO family protein [Rhizomicrobium sp.]
MARRFLILLLPVLLLALGLTGCGLKRGGWHSDNITGTLPSLKFSMLRVNDDHEVTAANYRGDVVLLYFGYTNCPDICPTTLANLSAMLRRLGPAANHVRVLFVSVDPTRDRPKILRAYVHAFSPYMDGLLGTPNSIAILARRYRVAYSVHKATAHHPYEVNHSAAVFIFDRSGHARLVTLSTSNVNGLASDVRRLLEQNST